MNEVMFPVKANTVEQWEERSLVGMDGRHTKRWTLTSDMITQQKYV